MCSRHQPTFHKLEKMCDTKRKTKLKILAMEIYLCLEIEKTIMCSRSSEADAVHEVCL